MEISTTKFKIMVTNNSNNNTSANITLNGERLKEVNNFKYLGATLSKDGTCATDIRARIAIATTVLVRLTRLWKSTISFVTNNKLYKTLVVSIFLYGCEAWTLSADSEKKIQ